MPNGIDLILADHRLVEALFESFRPEGGGVTIGIVVDKLEAHDQAEQAALYPLAASLLGAEAVARAELAHAAVKRQIDVVTALEGAPLVEAFAGLRALVEAHVADEQDNLLPALAAAATPQQLDELGARILQAKQRVG